MGQIVPATPENIKKAGNILKEGGLVAFPTETVYGVGGDATNPSAIEKIYLAKNRPSNNPLIVHIYDINLIPSIADIKSEEDLNLKISAISKFWPGPLSVILPRARTIAPAVGAGLNSVAVRIPSHPIALALLKESGVPVAAPSANRSSYVSATSAEHVLECLGNNVDLILDGGQCKIGVESTILSLIHNPPKILRPGAISFEDLRLALGSVVNTQVGKSESEDSPLSPGRLKEHYAPLTPVALLSEINPSDMPKNSAFISFHSELSLTNCKITRILSNNEDHSEISSTLFATLRELDKMNLDLIIIDTCKEEGLGVAIMDRIRRASARSR